MKGLPRASSAAAGGPKAGARLFSFGAEPGAVPRGARGVDTNVEVRSNGQSAARPRSNQTFEPETKRSGQGPPLCAAPEKSRGIVTRANRRGQPRRPFLWIFAAARRAPSRAAALALAGLVGALATPPARAAPLRSAGEHDRVDDVAARYVGDPAAAVRELRELVAAGRASATEAVAAALLAPAEGPPELAAVVARPGLALELIRRLPRPTPAAWLPALAAETGGGGIVDEALLEWIGKAPPAAARMALRSVAARARAGRGPVELLAAADNLLASLEEVEGLAELFADQLRPEADVVAAARFAYDSALARGRTGGRAAEVADVERELFARHPELPSLALDACAASIESGDRARAQGLLEVVARANSGANATAAIEALGQAHLALAWSAWLGDASRGVAATAAAAARALPRPPLAQEDALAVLALRGALVASWVEAGDTKAAVEPLVEALTAAPVVIDRCFVDEAFFGPFGPAWAREPAGRARRAEAWLAAALALVEAIEHSHARARNGLLAAKGPDDDAESGDDERVASWVFTRAAEALLTDRGDPEAALALITPRLTVLEQRRLPINQLLLVEARLVAARCHLYRGDRASAEEAVAAALATATGLQRSAGAEFVQRLARGDAAAPPAGRPFFRIVFPHAPLVARILVMRSNLRATLANDVDGASADLLAAGTELPWDGGRWLHCAVDFARRGRREAAEACLACVERSPTRLYDLACVHALLGRPEQAATLLAEHLARRCVTGAGRALELAYARRDPDLAPARSHPKFPRE